MHRLGHHRDSRQRDRRSPFLEGHLASYFLQRPHSNVGVFVFLLAEEYRPLIYLLQPAGADLRDDRLG